MLKTEKIELLHKIACTINHDTPFGFVPGETERLDLIKELLKKTDYKLAEIGLCQLYSKHPIDEIAGPITVLSSHIDTHRGITSPFSEIRDEKKLCGTYDNSITNTAILSLMLDDRLPDTVVVAFTGNEENGMKGADDLGDYLLKQDKKANIIVTDVTPRSYKGKNVFSLENCCRSGSWTNRVIEVMTNSGFKGEFEENYEDDETLSYNRHGFECFSFCIPTKGEMHDNSGLKTRISTYNKYVEALCVAACA